MNDVLESALNYIREGFQVFPLQSNSKSKQVVKSWKEEATTDKEVIQNWFSNTDYNVGVRTGNGLIVIDIDNKNEVNGYESIKSFLKDFPSTKIVKTPNNGWHMYYRVDREISCRTGIVKGVDIRGSGGYVVGIGSVINGNRYFVSRDEPIAQANEAIYKFLEMKSMVQKNIEVEEVIYQGKRNDYLFRMGCFLQQKGFSDEAIACCIEKENELKCSPPLEVKEVHQIIKSALHYNKGFTEVRDAMHYEGSYTVTQLLSSETKEDPDIVEDLISLGLVLFGAPQKSGKTFFGLQLCDAIANWKDFLGRKVQKGTALYLAFEDTMPKIKKRLKTMQVEKNDHFVIDILKSNPDYNVESRIQKELSNHYDLKIVIVDTFAKIRKSKERDYESEYSEASFYHELALKYGIAILLVTHVRKEIDINHPFDSIYGSRGLMAGSDSILVMYKKHHLSKNRQLAIQGKDIPDDEQTLMLNDNQILEVVEQEIEDDIDENLSKVVNYVVREKTYLGSHEALCSKLSLPLTGRSLQALLSKNKELLESTFINYEKAERTNKARQIKLTYYGDEEVQ